MNAIDQPINTRAAWRPVLRPLAKLLVAAQLALVLQPLSVLAQDKAQAPYNPQAQAQLQRLGALSQTIEQAKARKAKEQQSPADKVSDKLARVHELVAQLKQSGTPNKAPKQQELKDSLQTIQAGVADVRAEFAATRAELQRKNLPAEILQRHDEALALVEQRAAQFNAIAKKANSDDDKLRELDAYYACAPSNSDACHWLGRDKNTTRICAYEYLQ